MAKVIRAKDFIVLLSILSIGCAEGHCRHVETQDSPQKIKTPSLTAAGASANQTEDAKRVLIYKDDGSLQCSKKKGISLDEMAKTLAPDIRVFTSTKRSDGLMHVQVCGQKTGQVNVFEILENELSKAKAKSFKLWNLD